MLSEMKHLVEINAAVNYGATGLVAQREGWECTMVHGPRYVNPSQLPCICTQGKWGDRMHGVRSLLLDGHGLGSKRATERLVRRLDALQPDVVHLHNVHAVLLVAARGLQGGVDAARLLAVYGALHLLRFHRLRPMEVGLP